jgi:hypothetical protein
MSGALAAAGDPVGYVFDAQGTEHVLYRGVDARVHDLCGTPGVGWTDTDLTGATGAPLIAGEPCGYVFKAQATQHVVFRGDDYHVHELSSAADGVWQHDDLTQLASAPGVVSDPFGYAFEAQGSRHVVYQGADDHVHELYGG